MLSQLDDAFIMRIEGHHTDLDCGSGNQAIFLQSAERLNTGWWSLKFSGLNPHYPVFWMRKWFKMQVQDVLCISWVASRYLVHHTGFIWYQHFLHNVGFRRVRSIWLLTPPVHPRIIMFTAGSPYIRSGDRNNEHHKLSSDL